mgnify:CR=1 FL=1
MQTIPCHRCKTPFERKRRGPIAHHCPGCRATINREKQRERNAAYRERAEIFHAALPEDVGVLPVRSAAAYFAALSSQTIVMDRQPAGWLSPGGSDDGRSTHFDDLTSHLDRLAEASANDPWWSQHPHWCVDL